MEEGEGKKIGDNDSHNFFGFCSISMMLIMEGDPTSDML